jgi:hypothetical protein
MKQKCKDLESFNFQPLFEAEASVSLIIYISLAVYRSKTAFKSMQLLSSKNQNGSSFFQPGTACQTSRARFDAVIDEYHTICEMMIDKGKPK